MSALSDALRAIQQVVLMQSDVARLQGDFLRLADDVRGMKDFTNAMDRRLVRIETMIEISTRASGQPRIEG